jgi:hypothetical protein
MRASPKCHTGSRPAFGGAFVGLLALLVSCSRDPAIVERQVIVFSPRACPVSQSEAYSVIYAGGDFEPSVDKPPVASVFLRETGHTMNELPKETRSLVVDVSQREIDWHGVAELPASGAVNVLVWPGGESCRLTRDVEQRTDFAFGVVGQRFIVAGGRSPDGAQVPHTFVGDLTTGIVEALPIGLNTRRSSPSITPFGDDALVAGGHDPESGIGDVSLRAIATAEVYVPKNGEFDQQRIDLSEPRTRHGAIVLASGETLLVGGRGPAGPLRTMEIVDPATRRARTAGVALMRIAREKPTVLRLASGEILIAGGTDAAGNQVPTLEWFAPDAGSATKRPVDLVAGRERAFVALEAGGALAVIKPATDSPDFKTVWVISADGTLAPGLPVDPATLDAVRLFAGAEGAPALWTGRRWMRWSPWFGGFEAIADAPDKGPALGAIANGDSGLALWLDDRGAAGFNVTGFRFTARTRFGAVPKPLLTAISTTDQLAPDRLAGIAGSSMHFDQERGLLLGPGASAFLTDLTFGDFALSFDVTAGAPVVVVRPERGDELEIGGLACAFAQAATKSLGVRRHGRQLFADVDATGERLCPTELDANTRVALGLRGAQGASESGARTLIVTRR